MHKKPFFILGCVRSGTTFLRNVLRHHPDLAAPEETHFYRWPDPFGTPASLTALLSNPVLMRHREIDNISQELFKKILHRSTSRADLYRRYMRHYIERNKPAAKRWFDKTPQNVYGASMLAREFPGAKLIHIVRNPLDVVASLRVGKVMSVPRIIGACNYWIEAIEIMSVVKRAYPARVYEVRYEDLTSNLFTELPRLFEFIAEEYDEALFSEIASSPREHDYAELFTQKEYEKIVSLCRPHAIGYGYLKEQVQ